LKLTPEDCKELIYKLAKKGHTPSQIGNFNNNALTLLLIKFSLAENLLKETILNKPKANYLGDLRFFNLISLIKYICKIISDV